MKVLKIILVSFAALVLVAVVAVALFLVSPGLQKSVVMGVLGRSGEMQVKIGHIDLDLGGAEARDVHVLTADGLGLSLDALDVRLSPLALVRKHVKVSRAHATGIVVDLTQFRPTPELDPDEPSGPFEGIFKPLRDSGLRLTVDDVKVEGRIFLPQEQRGTFALGGGGIAPGATGELQSQVQLQLRGGVEQLRSQQLIAVTQDAGGLSGVTVRTESTAHGPSIDGVAQVSANVELLRVSAGEQYTVTVAVPGGPELARLDALLEAATPTIAFVYRSNIDDSTLAALGVAGLLPPLQVRGEGQGRVNLADLRGNVSGTLAGNFTPPSPEGAPPLPSVRFDSRFDAASDGQVATLSTLLFSLGFAEQTVLELVLPQPLRVELADPIASLPAAGERLLELRIDLPFSSLGALAEPLGITGGGIGGHLAIAVEGETLKLLALQPVGVHDLKLAREGQPALEDVSLTLSPNASLSVSRIEFSTGAIHGAAGGTRFLDGELRGSADLRDGQPANIEIGGRLASNLDAVYALAVPGDDPGRQGDFEALLALSLASLESALDARLTAHLRNVVPGGSDAGIEVLTAELSAQRGSMGLIQIVAPVSIDGPSGRTALRLEGTVDMPGDAVVFNLNLTSRAVFVDDLQLLAAAYTPPAGEDADEAEPEAEPDRTPDTRPAWAGLQGTFRTNINRIVAAGQEISNLQAIVRMNGSVVELQEFQATYAGTPATASFRLAFGPPAATPYALQGAFAVRGFDLSAADRNVRGDDSHPLIEGLFDVQAELAGSGPNLPTAAEWIDARVRMTANQAVFYPLGSVKLGSGAVGTAAGLASRFLQDQEYQRSAVALEEVGALLQGIRAERIEIDAEARQATDIRINQMLIQTPQLMFSGTGRVDYQPETSLLNQPMTLDLRLAAKGNAGAALNQLGLLNAQQNPQGYYLGPSYTTSGTVSNPKSALGEILTKSVTRALTGQRLDVPELQFRPKTPQQTEEKPQPSPLDALNQLKGLLNRGSSGSSGGGDSN